MEVRELFGHFFLQGYADLSLSTMMNPGPGVGASGAIFGLIALLISFLWTNESSFVLRTKRIYVALGVWSVYSIGCGFLNPLIDNMAHVGGFLGGIVGSLFWRPLILEYKNKQEHS